MTDIRVSFQTILRVALSRAARLPSPFPLTPSSRLAMSAAMEKPWESSYRLPSSVQPAHYDLYLHPRMEEAEFSGRVTVHLDVSAEQRHFAVHVARPLEVTATRAEDSGGNELAVAEAFEYKPHEFWVVALKESAPGGKYRLTLDFRGRLDQSILGFYRSVYRDERGQKRTIATSKFQPTYARRCFPCMDEPSFKSTYSITLVKPSDPAYIAMSNMPVQEEKPDRPSSGLTEVTFQKSVPMVTYLAVFIVCDFVYIEAKPGASKAKIPIRVYGTSRQKERLQYSLDACVSIADYYTSYFNVPYPLPKLDLAAIPDYSSGATEHWGLVTFRETNLAFDPRESGEANRRRVALVVAHELAHQWFGNLMTVHWWNDLWLNEGFATYIEYKGISAFEPTWDTESMFLVGDLYPVFALDATFASHPIVNNVETPDQINAVFDMISYSKGASVIRMLEDFLGSESFRRGLKAFLEKYSFKTATTQDLLFELSKACKDDIDVTKVMNTWTRQKGFPVVTVTKRDDGSFTLSQDRFLSDGDARSDKDEESEFSYRWEVPVTYVTQARPNDRKMVWLHQDGRDVEIKSSEDGWIKLNVGQRGYYRVNYPDSCWRHFAQALASNPGLFPACDRTGLLSDAFAAAAAGRLPFAAALDLTKYMADGENDLAPWEVVLDQLGQLTGTLGDTPAAEELKSFRLSLISRLLGELGWADEGPGERRLLRSRVLMVAGACGHEETLSRAADELLKWKDGGGRVSPNLRDAVYKLAIKKLSSDRAVWDWLLEKYRAEENAQEKLKLLQGLASTEDAATLSDLLSMARDEDVVRSQDYFTLLTFMTRSKVGRERVWRLLQDEWRYLVDRFTLNDRLFGRLLATVAEGFADEDKLRELQAHFDKNPEAGAGEQYRRIALESVRNNMKFAAKYSAQIADWLKENNGK